jgi:hypothetical protein
VICSKNWDARTFLARENARPYTGEKGITFSGAQTPAKIISGELGLGMLRKMEHDISV